MSDHTTNTSDLTATCLQLAATYLFVFCFQTENNACGVRRYCINHTCQYGHI